ncbi:universal stress protein [Actinoplanes sp. GCM10030250]|uniref:universal stress protein n=1 Tax=Actinoplanes sp. GCM10030250 TaxID=3273376 RepID=UPI00360C10A4
MRTPAIVVAVDGTDSSRAAVRWAAREAELSNQPLLLVHVMDWDWAAARYDFGSEHFETARKSADGIAARAATEATTVAPAIDVSTDVAIGDPSAQLIIASEGAHLLVLGNRGRGGFAGLHLGSVSQRVAMHAACPIVVVRGRTTPLQGPIAVGIDDTDGADEVLEAAFTAARARGTSLSVIRSFVPVLMSYWGHLPPAQVHTPEQDDAERARLTAQLAPWREKYPDVPVEILLSHDSAAALLVGVSHGTQLVVVGSRGHGVIAGTLLGSTGLQLLHHAECPVLIVRPHGKRDSGR